MSEKKQRKKAESESKQEKANRIISEAIAKAKERGERNIPRVMSPENFPSASIEGKDEKKGRRMKSKPKDKESKKTKTCSKLKEKTKIGFLSNGRVVAQGSWAAARVEENPSEEDAAIVDKILSSRIIKKEMEEEPFNPDYVEVDRVLEVSFCEDKDTGEEHKVLLTGTPLQNTVEELFSLLHFLEPLRFPSESTFMQEFGDLKTEEQVQKLQAILKPMMLRRLKEDVEKKLAPKEETIIEVELTNIQKKYYRAILEKNFSFLSKGAGQTNVPNLVNTMMELRKCCNHPYLIKGAEEKILGEFRDTYNPAASDFHLQAMIQSAGKLVLIDKLLPKMKAGGHKVLIFSQMVRCLDILEDYLIHKRYLYERIDGRVRGNLRQAAIDRFSKPDSDRFVFLLCTRAGGLGINLTAADTCIIFDSDWNPQNDLQIQQLSKKEIEDLLRRGAYGAIMEEEDEGSKFCEEDIDQILLRRTKTITIESEGRGSTFAKNSLVIDTPRIRKQTRPFSATKDELAELSEAESEGDEKPKLRRPCERSNGYGRTECFRVEKNLLVYGVLLRVRMLYYLKQEVIGNECQKVFDGVDASDIDVWVPEPDHSEVPAEWWDFDADKSLLIGVFKHGYEKYNTIRADPALCFLERVGKPDEKAVAAEQRANDYMDGWTRREEADFYRVVSTFGVVFDPDRGQFDWTKFRAMARLHKKTDDSLEKYLYAFMSMCRRVCRLPSKEELVDPNIFIQPITEERASRTLYRIELLRKTYQFGGNVALMIGTCSLELLNTGLLDPKGIILEDMKVKSENLKEEPQSSEEESMSSEESRTLIKSEPDRVMINRLDSICQTVLKGKWPSARRSYDANTVASFYTTKLLDSSGAASEYSEPSVPTPPGAGVKEEHDQSAQMSKVKKHEGGLKLTFQKQGLAQRRPLDSEDGALGQQQYLTRLRELQGTPIQSTLGANGVILDNQPIVKKRRGRRKNVEGVDILFFNRNKPPNNVTLGLTTSQISAGINPTLSYTQPQGIPDTESPVPVINLKDGTRLAGDDAPKRKDLEKWLKEHPGYVEDLGAFIPVGGAFAPPLKDLCRFLEENSEYGVAPEWGDVVKQSGFLPESMYERILTGPVVREEVSRRGRRPKSGIAKATAAAAAATATSISGNPLLANGLLPGVDLPTLQALQQNLQNLQSLQVTAGLMGMPAGLSSGGEAKNVAAMFPMLLSGMTGLPNLLGMGGLLTKPTESGTEEKKGNDSKELEGKKERTESQNSENGGENSVSSSPSTSSTAALNTAAAANPLALNPLLLSNILYPGMLLTPGLNLHIPTLSQSNTFDVQKNKNSDLGSSKSVKVKEEDSRVRDQEDKGGTEPSPLNENSTDEGSEKADASSGSDSTSSSSEDSDSSNED
ncbi:hypothetical protein CB1_000856013 [Camelus ferus]|nr:hypothetical protein CB1_000856013 [Camelus ferus]